MNIYAVIIGTEILNGRRQDKHFAFLKKALLPYGHTLFASFTIKDDAALMNQVFQLVRRDSDAIMVSFGGIGSTPDDLTREIAATVFTCKGLVRHQEFAQDIVEHFGDEAYPHRIKMADLPEGAELLKNPVNNMSGFCLQERYFFVPGFPEMAHPMVEAALKQYLKPAHQKYRQTLRAYTSENTLIDTMKRVPTDSVELSSLPMLRKEGAAVEISLLSDDVIQLSQTFALFEEVLRARQIAYDILE